MRDKKRQQDVDELLAQVTFPQSSTAAPVTQKVPGPPPAIEPTVREPVVLKSVPTASPVSPNRATPAAADEPGLSRSTLRPFPALIPPAVAGRAAAPMSATVAAADALTEVEDQEPGPDPTAADSPEAGFGARPVAITSTSAGAYALLDSVAEAGLLERLRLDGSPRLLPTDPAEVALLAAGPLQGATPVIVAGIDGGAGRTAVTRLLVQCGDTVRGPGQVVAVDGVPVWGGLTAEVDLWGPVSVPDAQGLSGATGDEFFAALSSSAGARLLPGPRPEQLARSGPRETLSAIAAALRHAPLIVIDSVADPTSAVPAAVIEGAGVICLVGWATARSVAGMEQLLSYADAAGAADVRARTVVALRGVERRWGPDVLAAVKQLRGSGVEAVRIPHASRFDPAAPPPGLVTAGIRLLAAVVARSR